MILKLDAKAQGNNVILKLDMAKAYDRISCLIFFLNVLRKFGFCEIFIDLIWRLLSKNWNSLVVNGNVEGFFTSSRG